MAAPRLRLRSHHQLRLNRVEANIADHGRQISVGLQDQPLVPPPTQLAVSALRPVEALGIHHIHVAHDPHQISLRRAKTQMVVIPPQKTSQDLDPHRL